MNNKNSWIFLVIGLMIGGLVMHFCSNYTIQKKDSAKVEANERGDFQAKENSANENSSGGNSIEDLTNETKVIDFVKKNHELPDCYVKKSEARKAGWNPSQGNLCEVLPGKAIGGDHFSNREKSLPAGNHYFEADVNYHCGNRQTDRIIFTKNGDVWLTKDHYKSFQKQ